MPDISEGHDVFAASMAKLAAGDLNSARQLVNRAADAGYLPAIQMYAVFAEYGVGGRPNVTKAMLWFERAAQSGDETACIDLARRQLAMGNAGGAKFWLKRAYRNPHAKLMLLNICAQSRSVRATREAKRLLAGLGLNVAVLGTNEQEKFRRLRIEFEMRTTDIRWAEAILKQKANRGDPRVSNVSFATVKTSLKQKWFPWLRMRLLHDLHKLVATLCFQGRLAFANVTRWITSRRRNRR